MTKREIRAQRKAAQEMDWREVRDDEERREEDQYEDDYSGSTEYERLSKEFRQ